MSFPVVPPDTRAPGQSGHILDHNAISDSLSAIESAIAQLQAQFAGAIVLSSQQTASYVLSPVDLGTVVEMNSASAVTVTIPPSSQTPFPVGAIVSVAQMGVGVVTIVAGGGVTILAAAGASVSTGQYTQMQLRQRALNIWVVGGDVT